MDLQTGEFPGWDRSPVAFIRTCVVSQFATIATHKLLCFVLKLLYHDNHNRNRKLIISATPTKAKSREPAYYTHFVKKIDRQRVRSRESGRQTVIVGIKTKGSIKNGKWVLP